MSKFNSQDSQAIIGRTITGVISKPVSGGGQTLMMLQFSDGTCFEFVSPRSARVIDQITQLARSGDRQSPPQTQLAMFPPDGHTQTATHLAA